MSRGGICRRLVGLADAVQHPDRHRAGDRLRAVGCDMACHEDRGRIARQGLSFSWFLLFAMIGAIGAVTIATRSGTSSRPNAGFLAEHHPDGAGADRGRRRHRAVAGSLAKKWIYQPVFLTLTLFALSDAGLGISIRPYIVPQSITIWQRHRREQPYLHAVRRGRADPTDSRLHRLVLLCIPRQGKGGERLSSIPPAPNPPPLTRRLLWFAARRLRRRRRHHPVLRPAAWIAPKRAPRIRKAETTNLKYKIFQCSIGVICLRICHQAVTQIGWFQ